jgi:hypothetical protein
VESRPDNHPHKELNVNSVTRSRTAYAR